MSRAVPTMLAASAVAGVWSAIALWKLRYPE
jgi:hypothetical protein